LGNARLTQEKVDGQDLLHIRAQESCAASWRTRALLERGQYRLEGRVRQQGVVLDEQDAKAGAGLRISRRKFSRKISGDMNWAATTFDFEVAEDQADMEIVCELRAKQGDVWFELGSLRLLRR
ncbi:MAG: hypothetical protein HY043_23470, partial [Verrucomicrobia bacterium]|nr:hypothetical protein [Verrucomicrobiota bacterium]